MKSAERLYQRLLAWVAADFRTLYGDEMARLYRERLTRAVARGRITATWVALAGLIDLGRVAWASHTPFQKRGDAMFTTTLIDLRIAARTLRRNPGFSLTVVTTLALGIGAVTTVLAVVQGAVLQPVPYPSPSRLMSIVQNDPRSGATPLVPPQLRDLRDHATGFDHIVGFSPSWGSVLNGQDERTVTTAYVSAQALELFGVRPVAGRLFLDHEHETALPVAVVTAAFWNRQFGEGIALGGQTILLADRPHTVVGVIPSAFRLPIMASIVNSSPAPAEVWLPFSLNPFYTVRTVPVLHVVGRLAQGITPVEAEAQLAAVSATLTQLMPTAAPQQALQLVPLEALVSAPVRRPLMLLLLAVGCLLMIGCANITNLMLARSASRLGELAVRTSLGATGRRLVAHLMMESLVLAGAGTVLGVMLAVWAVSAIPALLVSDLPPSATLVIDWRVAAMASLIGLACATLVGVWPAIRASRQTASEPGLLSGRLTDGAASRTRRALVGLEVALATTLLVGAGLMASSFWRLSHVNPGFQVDGLFATGVAFSANRYPTPEHRLNFVTTAIERLSGVSGVTVAAAVNRLPLGGSNTLVGIEVEGVTQPDGQPVPMDRRVITPTYFDTMAMRLRDGRPFGIVDAGPEAERVAILNEAAARRVGAGSVIGRRVRLMLRGGPGPWLRVVGVTSDIRHHGLGTPVSPEVYVPYAQAAVESMVFVVRTDRAPDTLSAPVRNALKAVDPSLPVLASNQSVVGDLVTASVARPRLRAMFVNGFAVMALGLAAIGIIGVVAYSVARQRRDIGVRLALGAQPVDILRHVVRGQLTPVAVGAVVGLASGALAAQTFAHMLFDVSPSDPMTLLAVFAIVIAVGLAAAYVPARQAMAIDPIAALRPE